MADGEVVQQGWICILALTEAHTEPSSTGQGLQGPVRGSKIREAFRIWCAYQKCQARGGLSTQDRKLGASEVLCC